jgi:hypothetical protein
MIKSILIYLKQRFNLLQFALLAIYLILFSTPVFKENSDFSMLIVKFIFLLAALFIFRLFDDLMHSEIDAEKPDRIYTQPNESKELKQFLLISSLLFLTALFIVSIQAALLLFSVMIFNVFLYVFLFKNAAVRPYLPLIKYPFLIILLAETQIYTFDLQLLLISLTVGVSFVVYEILEDESFPIQRKLVWVFIVLCFGLLFLTKINQLSLIICVSFFVLSLFFSRFKVPQIPYLFLLLLLLNHLIIQNI